MQHERFLLLFFVDSMYRSSFYHSSFVLFQLSCLFFLWSTILVVPVWIILDHRPKSSARMNSICGWCHFGDCYDSCSFRGCCCYCCCCCCCCYCCCNLLNIICLYDVIVSAHLDTSLLKNNPCPGRWFNWWCTKARHGTPVIASWETWILLVFDK